MRAQRQRKEAVPICLDFPQRGIGWKLKQAANALPVVFQPIRVEAAVGNRAIHAGVECGILSGKLPGLDCVSFGPDLVDIHTAREKMSISSVQRTWKFLLGVLEALKD